jgi:hypothetical protein
MHHSAARSSSNQHAGAAVDRDRLQLAASALARATTDLPDSRGWRKILRGMYAMRIWSRPYSHCCKSTPIGSVRRWVVCHRMRPRFVHSKSKRRRRFNKCHDIEVHEGCRTRCDLVGMRRSPHTIECARSSVPFPFLVNT